jgi:hypothetical protein
LLLTCWATSESGWGAAQGRAAAHRGTERRCRFRQPSWTNWIRFGNSKARGAGAGQFRPSDSIAARTDRPTAPEQPRRPSHAPESIGALRPESPRPSSTWTRTKNLAVNRRELRRRLWSAHTSHSASVTGRPRTALSMTDPPPGASPHPAPDSQTALRFIPQYSTKRCGISTRPSVSTQRMLTHARRAAKVQTLENVVVRSVFRVFVGAFQARCRGFKSHRPLWPVSFAPRMTGRAVFPRPNVTETERTAGFAAAVAQLVEHLLGKEEVMGSSPISSSRMGRRTEQKPTSLTPHPRRAVSAGRGSRAEAERVRQRGHRTPGPQNHLV